MFGTASYATNALSASYAPGAAVVTFPYTGSAIISGSLTVTGSLSVQDTAGKTNIDSSNRKLYDVGPAMPPGASSVLSVDWGNRTLVRSNGATSVDWENRIAYDLATSSSIKWEARELWDGDPDTLGYNTASLDWNNRIAKDANALPSIDWNNRDAFDASGVAAIDWSHRVLNTPNSITALNWGDDTYLDSNVYQRDYKSAATQDVVSTTYNNPSVSYLGDVIESDGTTTAIHNTVTEGMLVYLDTNTIWYPVNQAATGATKLLGIAHNLVSLPPSPPFLPNQSGWILLEGHVVIDQFTTSGPGPYVNSPGYGLPVYIEDSTTTGSMSTVVPTTIGLGSNIVRVLGHCYQQNSNTYTQWMMKFRPSNDWIEI
jgi:hypothetical protein